MKKMMILLLVLLSVNMVFAQDVCNQKTIIDVIEGSHRATRIDNHDYIDNKIDQFEVDTEGFMNAKLNQFEQIIDGSSKKFMLILMLGMFALTFLVNGLFGLLRLKKEKKILLTLNDNIAKTNMLLNEFIREFKRKVI